MDLSNTNYIVLSIFSLYLFFVSFLCINYMVPGDFPLSFCSVTDLAMHLLQRLYGTDGVRFHIVNAFRRHFCRRHRSDIGRFRLDRGLAQIAVVIHAVLAHRRIDNQVEIAVGDHIPPRWDVPRRASSPSWPESLPP